MDSHDEGWQYESSQSLAEKVVISSIQMWPQLHEQALVLTREHFGNGSESWRIFCETMEWAKSGGGSQLEIIKALKAKYPHIDWLGQHIDMTVKSSHFASTEESFKRNVWLLQSFAAGKSTANMLLQASEAANLTNYGEAADICRDAAEKFALLAREGRQPGKTIGEAATEVYNRIVDGRPNIGPPVGLSMFDVGYARTAFAPGKLVVICARPSVGKTALGLQLARRLAQYFGVGYWSCEMGAEEMAARMISSDTAVKLARVISGKCDSSDLARIRTSVGGMTEERLLFDDTDSADLNSVVALGHMVRDRFGSCGAIFCDYFQSMSPLGRYNNTHLALGEVSRALKSYARRTNTLVVVMAQLNRKIEDRDDGQFRMSDLGECGRLEQDADIVLFLDRPYARNRGGSPRDASIYSAKFRGAVAGVTKRLDFDGETQLFHDVA